MYYGNMAVLIEACCLWENGVMTSELYHVRLFCLSSAAHLFKIVTFLPLFEHVLLYHCVHSVLVLTVFLYLNVMQYFRIPFKRIIDSLYLKQVWQFVCVWKSIQKYEF